jgi:tricarballylate dehydrogenase
VRSARPQAPSTLPEGADVIVIGGGNAALAAALEAHAGGAAVLLIERAPRGLRGGNTRHTRNVRCVHQSADAYNSGAYLFDELWSDLCGVGSGPSDEGLASLTVRESESVPAFMSAQGVRWQRPLSGTLHLGRTNRFFLGGGTALVNTYFHTAEARGIAIAYDHAVSELVIEGDRVTAVIVDGPTGRHRIAAQSVVCASGGFEANIEWLRRYWGDAADNYVIRGPRFNDGAVLAELYRHGAASAGEERGFHAIAVDARAPRFDGGIATRIDAIPFGIVLNRNAERFYDEGEELWPKRYAIWGRNIAEQPDQLAYVLWDTKVNECFLPPMYRPVRADTIAEVVAELGLDEARAVKEIESYNDAVHSNAPFDPSRLDGRSTEGLAVPKSNWAQRLDTPPYYGLALRPGITFTYLGVAVDEQARVRRVEGGAFSNLFAAGEIMSGNVLSSGYLAGFGLTIGTVWGRIAGRGAAHAAA